MSSHPKTYKAAQIKDKGGVSPLTETESPLSTLILYSPLPHSPMQTEIPIGRCRLEGTQGGSSSSQGQSISFPTFIEGHLSEPTLAIFLICAGPSFRRLSLCKLLKTSPLFGLEKYFLIEFRN